MSLDQPRSLTFIYSSGLASPNGLVQMNVVDNPGTPPDRVSIQLLVNGAAVTNEVVYRAGAGATRVAASIDGRDHRSVAMPVTAVVRKYWPDGRMQEFSIPTRAVIVNERYSQTGMGWVLAGMQQLRDQGDGVLITESGTGVWFWRVGTDANGDRRYASPAGDFTRVRWDAASGMYWRDYPDGSRARFRSDGRMASATDRFGNATQYVYGGSGELTRVIDPLGKEFQLFYTGYGALAAVQDPAGRRVNTGTNNASLFRFQDPDGSLGFDGHFYTHEGRWFLETWWAGGGDRNVGAHTGHTVAYDAQWKLASVTSPQVNTTDAGATRPVTQFRSLEAAVLAPAGTGTHANPAPRVQPHEVRVQVTDPRGNATRLALDPFGAPTRVEAPLGAVIAITRDRDGRVVRTDAPNGHTLLNEYVGVELRNVIDATTGTTVSVAYEPVFHQPTHIWGSSGVTEVWNTYDTNDPQRKLVSTRRGTSTAPETQFTYTTRGRVSSVTDPEGHGTFYSYGAEAGANAWGNVYQVSMGTASGTYRRTTTVEYDGYGRTVAVTGPGGEVSRTVYDLVNRVLRTVGPQQDTIRYEHRATGLYRVTDPKGQSYAFNRNLLGWVESEVDPRNQYTYYGYDRAGNATSMTNRRGQAITSVYDALGRVTTRTADGQQTTWSYDPAHRWMQAGNAESTSRVEFDAAGRAMRMITTIGGVSYTQALAYDAQGRRTQMDVTGPWAGARSIAYTYNTLGQLATLRDFGGTTATLTHNDDGQEESRTLPSALTMGRSYISTHAPGEVWVGPGTLNDQLGMAYGYGATGRVATRSNRYSDASGWGTLVRHYEYDTRGWLTRMADEKVPATSAGPTCDGTVDNPDTGETCTPAGPTEWVGSATWSYDAAGNRINASATVEAGNRLTAIDGYQFSYDADGNLTRKLKPGHDDLALSWNSLGQLASAWRYQQGTASYGYDAFGRRVRRTAPNGTVTRYLYDGDDLLMELDGAGNPVREYTYLPGVDRPHSVRVSATGASYYYMTDHPGSVTALIDGSHQIVNQYKYGPWGEPEQVTEGVQQPLGYAAREWDPVAGLYQVRARWYDPQTGRFVSEDPIGLAGGINQYAYAANSPVNYRDPSGLCPPSKCLDPIVVVAGPECSSPSLSRGANGVCQATETPITYDSDPGLIFFGYGGMAATPIGGATAAGGLYVTKNGDAGVFISIGYAFGVDASHGPIAGIANAMSNFQKRSGYACTPATPAATVCAAGSNERPNVLYGGRAINLTSWFGGGWSAGESYTFTIPLPRACPTALNAPDLC